jgi:hypothetical protein
MFSRSWHTRVWKLAFSAWGTEPASVCFDQSHGGPNPILGVNPATYEPGIEAERPLLHLGKGSRQVFY